MHRLWRRSRCFVAAVLLITAFGSSVFGYGATYVHFAQLATSLQGNARYDYVYVTGLASVDGMVTLAGVSTRWDGQISAITGGHFVYNGPKAGIAGQTFGIDSATVAGYGLSITSNFQLPAMLGGGSVSIPFVTDYTGALEPTQTASDIAGTYQREALKIQNARFNLGPDGWTLGGSARLTLSSLRTSFNAGLTFTPGVGGAQSDLTCIRVTNQTGIPIGVTPGVLDIVDASIENDAGLSPDANWAASNLVGQFNVTLAMSASTGIATTCTISGQGTVNVHSGAFDITGTGKLLNYFDLTDVRVRYTPTAVVVGTAEFASPVYSGSVSFSLENGTFGGTMKGKLAVPSDVVLFGGQTVEDVGSKLGGIGITGSSYVNMLMPRECFERCATVCVPIPYCSDFCWRNPPTFCCSWSTKDVCKEACLSDVCIDPMVRNVPFDFSFDGNTGNFSFVRTGPQPRNEALDPAPNWHGTEPTGITNGPTDAEYIFNLEQIDAGILFRTSFTNLDVLQVDMTVTAPDGSSFSSASGALPNGYANQAGYSRFNSAAREQIIVLTHPVPGSYRIRVTNTDQLGGVAVQCLLQDPPPACDAVRIEDLPQEGLYRVSCERAATVTSSIVAAFLVPEGNGESVLAATADPAARMHAVLVDTTGLNVPAGNYRITLAVLDGTDAIGYCASNDVIVIASAGRPESPTNIRYRAEDGAFVVQWAASPSADVIGYVVQYGPDIAPMHAGFEAFVAADGSSDQQVEIADLDNGAPLLVRVLAVASDATRSAASEVVRVTPMPAGITRMPRIVSYPLQSATVGLRYTYLPVAYALLDDGESAVWALERSPAGMSIAADTGLIAWVPTADQQGTQEVEIRITMLTSEGTTSATQGYMIDVYPEAELVGGLSHAYSWFSYPAVDAFPGETYTYSPSIVGPDENITYDLQIGPERMWCDAATGKLIWPVPFDTNGHWVRLRAIVGGKYEMTQDYYVSVRHDDDALTSPEDVPPLCGCLCGVGSVPALLFAAFSLMSMKRLSPWCSPR